MIDSARLPCVFIVNHSENNWILRASQKTEKLSHEEAEQFYITKVSRYKLKYILFSVNFNWLSQTGSMIDCLTDFILKLKVTKCGNSFA